MRFLSPDNMTSLARTRRATDETRISAQRSHNLICLVREGTQGRSGASSPVPAATLAREMETETEKERKIMFNKSLVDETVDLKES